jgi:hypothetical protein
MTIKQDVLGFDYDDTEPAFTEMASGYYHHRVDKRLYDKPSFDAWLTAKGKSFAAGEVGPQSTAYKATHLSIASRGTAAVPAVPAAITASVTKAPTLTADDTGQITVAGGPADKAYTVTVIIKETKSGGDDIQNVAVGIGDTAAKVAGDIAAAISDPNVTSVAVGAVVTVTPSAGSTIAKLTVAVA